MTRLALEEMETTIGFSRTDKKAYIYCSDYVVMKQLDKLCEEQPDIYKVEKIQYYQDSDEICSKFYTVADKKYIKFAKKRILSEEQIEKLREKGRTLTEIRQGK